MRRLDTFQGNKPVCRTLSLQAGPHPAEVWLQIAGAPHPARGVPFSLLLLSAPASSRRSTLGLLGQLPVALLCRSIRLSRQDYRSELPYPAPSAQFAPVNAQHARTRPLALNSATMELLDSRFPLRSRFLPSGPSRIELLRGTPDWLVLCRRQGERKAHTRSSKRSALKPVIETASEVRKKTKTEAQLRCR